jgi:hypothetical protein
MTKKEWKRVDVEYLQMVLDLIADYSYLWENHVDLREAHMELERFLADAPEKRRRRKLDFIKVTDMGMQIAHAD